MSSKQNKQNKTKTKTKAKKIKQNKTKQKQNSRKRKFWKEVKFIIGNFNNLNFKAEYSKLDVSILQQKRNLVLN